MNDADVLEIWILHSESMLSVLLGFFSVTSAFLAVGYLVGRTIPSNLCAIVIVLYSIMALTLTATVQRSGVGAMSVRDKLVSMGADWHTVVSEPQAIFPTVLYSMVSMMTAVSVVSILYFLQQRKLKSTD